MKNKENVINWAKDKGLIKPENSSKQFIKTVEELGEVASALAKGNKEGFIDGIGDVVVTLIILAEQNGLDIEDCLEHAWNEIKDRTGKTVNGVFIKN
jgi:NTP pyrophosphatase (non-canonical NTP hydrolase)